MQQTNLNTVKQQLEELLGKEVDRRQFLRHVGFGLVAMTGIVSFIKALSGIDRRSVDVSSGYGSSAYGGVSRLGK